MSVRIDGENGQPASKRKSERTNPAKQIGGSATGAKSIHEKIPQSLLASGGGLEECRWRRNHIGATESNERQSECQEWRAANRNPANSVPASDVGYRRHVLIDSPGKPADVTVDSVRYSCKLQVESWS